MAHVSLITLGVRDIARSAAFYIALGWQRSAASVPDEVAFLRGSNIALALYGLDALHNDANVQATAQPDTTATCALAMNVSSAAAVDAFLARAAANGAEITRTGHATDWGGYSGYMCDPDGHLWEIAHNPGFSLDADGTVHLP